MIQFKIKDLENAMREPEVLAEVLSKVNNYSDSQSILQAMPRAANGWLEWMLYLYFNDGISKLTMGVIQRTPGAEVEFCT